MRGVPPFHDRELLEDLAPLAGLGLSDPRIQRRSVALAGKQFPPALGAPRAVIADHLVPRLGQDRLYHAALPEFIPGRPSRPLRTAMPRGARGTGTCLDLHVPRRTGNLPRERTTRIRSNP